MFGFPRNKTITVALPVSKKESQFRFNSGLLIKNEDGVSRIRGTAYDPESEKLMGAWGEVVIDGVEYYASVNIKRGANIEKACTTALGQAMAKSEIKGADQLLELLNLQLDLQRR
jgi:hypothetical protein